MDTGAGASTLVRLFVQPSVRPLRPSVQPSLSLVSLTSCFDLLRRAKMCLDGGQGTDPFNFIGGSFAPPITPLCLWEGEGCGRGRLPPHVFLFTFFWILFLVVFGVFLVFFGVRGFGGSLLPLFGVRGAKPPFFGVYVFGGLGVRVCGKGWGTSLILFMGKLPQPVHSTSYTPSSPRSIPHLQGTSGLECLLHLLPPSSKNRERWLRTLVELAHLGLHEQIPPLCL